MARQRPDCARREWRHARGAHRGTVERRQLRHALDTLPLVRQRPDAIVCDNGPEFVSLALDQWASTQEIRLDFIRAGHPVENCFIESVNGTLRDECLNQNHFLTLAVVQVTIETWRQEYNTEHPHRALGQRTPAEYAALFTPQETVETEPILRC